MEHKTIWFEETYVRSAETDFLRRWRISSFFAALVEAAAHHASHLGFGFQDMMARDMIWILSRLKIRFFEFPLVEEKITIQTWPKGLQQKLFFMRDYHVLGSDGRKFASATSAFVLINPRIRRILLPQALPGTIPDNHGLNALDELLDKVQAVGPLQEVARVQAGFSTVDLMSHVNNTRYIDWISDCFSFGEHQARTLDWLQINYVNEIKPGEQVALYRAAYPDGLDTWYITGTNLNTGAKAFEAALGWKSTAVRG